MKERVSNDLVSLPPATSGPGRTPNVDTCNCER